MQFELDHSQQRAWEAFLSRKNVGLFGRAGCAKSIALRRCIAHAHCAHGASHVGIITWTTSAAASILGGQTLHRFLRIGLAELPKEPVLEKVRANVFVMEKIKHIKVVFIDELPQLAASWFGVFEYVVRLLAVAHKRSFPWGGCHVVGMFSSSLGVH